MILRSLTHFPLGFFQKKKDSTSRRKSSPLNTSDFGKTKGELAKKFEQMGLNDQTSVIFKHHGGYDVPLKYNGVLDSHTFIGREKRKPKFLFPQKPRRFIFSE